MAVVSRREIQPPVIVEYFLPAETNWVEIQKAFAMMRSELGDERAKYDDAVKVRVTDEEIIFWFEKKTPHRM